jgi:hypothetical protein
MEIRVRSYTNLRLWLMRSFLHTQSTVLDAKLFLFTYVHPPLSRVISFSHIHNLLTTVEG